MKNWSSGHFPFYNQRCKVTFTVLMTPTGSRCCQRYNITTASTESWNFSSGKRQLHPPPSVSKWYYSWSCRWIISVFLTVTNNRTTSRIKSLVLSLIQSVHLKLHPLNQIWSLMALKKDGDGRNTVTNQLMDDITVGLKSVSNRSVRERRAAITMI